MLTRVFVCPAIPIDEVATFYTSLKLAVCQTPIKWRDISEQMTRLRPPPPPPQPHMKPQDAATQRPFPTSFHVRHDKGGAMLNKIKADFPIAFLIRR